MISRKLGSNQQDLVAARQALSWWHHHSQQIRIQVQRAQKSPSNQIGFVLTGGLRRAKGLESHNTFFHLLKTEQALLQPHALLEPDCQQFKRLFELPEQSSGTKNTPLSSYKGSKRKWRVTVRAAKACSDTQALCKSFPLALHSSVQWYQPCLYL